MDRFGARWTMASSILIVAIAFMLRSVMTELWHFYIFSAVMFAGVPGATMMPAGKLVLLWFPNTRGTMMGIVTSGNNIGSGIAVPVITVLIGLVGWRWTWALTGFALVALASLVVLVIRDRSEHIQRQRNRRWAPSFESEDHATHAATGLSVSSALQTSAFWLIATGITLQTFLRTGVISQMVPHLEQVGFARPIAATMMIVIAIFATCSKIIFGRLSESITARIAFILVMILQTIGLAILLFSGDSSVTWLAIGIIGLGMGGTGALTPLLIFDMFGVRKFGSIMGLSNIGIALPTVLGPFMAGLIYDTNGNYELMFIITALFLFISIACVAFAKVPTKHIKMLPID